MKAAPRARHGGPNAPGDVLAEQDVPPDPGRSSYRRLLAALQELLAGITDPDWETVATRLARYLLWEFEDYQEYDPRRRGG